MSELELPPVPEAVESQAYKPSGKYSVKAIPLMLGIGIIAAPLVGTIGFYLYNLIIPEIVIWILTITSFGGEPSELLVELVIAGLPVLTLFPAILGFLVASLIGFMADVGKCRNIRLATVVGLLSGIIGYGVLLFPDIREFVSTGIPERYQLAF